MVERITGIPKDQFLKAADLFTSVRANGDLKKVATIIYAVGWTQHTFGTQIIRTAAMLQLLLGNVGRAGGGVNALRGHSNIQGATDLAGVFDILPGYLKMPSPDDADFATYVKRITPTASKPSEWDSFNYWSNTPKFAVSFLKAMYGDAARKENDWGFHYLPKIDRNYSWTQIWDDMYAGSIKGLIAFGMNGVQIGPNSRKNIEALKKLDWLVVGEIYPDETSEFWRAPGTTAEEMKADPDNGLPAAVRGVRRKGRDVRELRAVAPVEERRASAAGRRASGSGHPRADLPESARPLSGRREASSRIPILNLAGRTRSRRIRRCRRSLERSTGRRSPTSRTRPARRSRPASRCPASPGSKTTGPRCAETGCTADRGPKRATRWRGAARTIRRASASTRTGRGRGRRTGASCTTAPPATWRASRGIPTRRQIWWNDAAGRWVGNDVPDFKADSKPSDHMGPFIMNPEGIGRLFAPLAAFAEGPFPEHYEPIESPIANPLHPAQSTNPVVTEGASRRWTSTASPVAGSTSSARRTA